MYKKLSIVDSLAPISSLTKGSKELFRNVSKDGYRIITKNSKPLFALVDISTFKELAMAKEELEELKKQKFNELVAYLQTVPETKPTVKEKQLMALYDNDVEEQERIKRIIEKRKQNVEKISTTY